MSITELKLKKDKEFIFNMWDFGNQLADHEINKLFLTPGAIYFITFNLSSSHINNLLSIEYLMKLIKQIDGDGPASSAVILVGTHIDVAEDQGIDITLQIDEIKKKFPKHKYPAFSGDVILFNAKSGGSSKATKEIKDSLVQILQEHPGLYLSVENSWIQLHQLMMRKANEFSSMPAALQQSRTAERKKPFFDWETYSQFAKGCGIEDSKIERATEFLIKIGCLLKISLPIPYQLSQLISKNNFIDMENLIFYHFDWLIEIIKKLISLKKVEKKENNSSSGSGLSQTSLSSFRMKPQELMPSASFNTSPSGSNLAGSMAGGSIVESGGFISYDNFKKLYKDQTIELQLIIESLLEKYGIIYYITTSKNYLVPSFLLFTKKPPLLFKKLFPFKLMHRLNDKFSHFGRFYQFSNLPVDLFSRLVVNLLSMDGVEEKLTWDNGLLMVFKSIWRKDNQENYHELTQAETSLNDGAWMSSTRSDSTPGGGAPAPSLSSTYTSFSGSAFQSGMGGSFGFGGASQASSSSNYQSVSEGGREQQIFPILYLSYNYSMNVCKIYLRFLNKIRPFAEKIWRIVLELIRNLFESFYGRLTETTIESLPCTHCMSKGIFDRPYLFPYSEAVRGVDEGNDILYCHNIKSPSRSVLLQHVSPDIYLADLPSINNELLSYGDILGHGAFGIVYKGLLNNDITVAIKKIKLKSDEQESKREYQEFQSECFIMNLLNHPNIVKFYGASINPPTVILQFISGSDLFNYMHKKTKDDQLISRKQEDFPWLDRYKIALDITHGLHYLQSYRPPIAHRDLRSPNIFLTAEGRALIGDFGLSRLISRKIGGILLTWQWIAPECLDSSKSHLSYDEKSDIYSLGMIFFELASISMPFEEYSEDPRFFLRGNYKLMEIKSAIINENLRPTIPPNTPVKFKNLIQNAWLHEPEQRIATSEIIKELTYLIKDEVNKITGGDSSKELDENGKPLPYVPLEITKKLPEDVFKKASNNNLSNVASNSSTASMSLGMHKTQGSTLNASTVGQGAEFHGKFVPGGPNLCCIRDAVSLEKFSCALTFPFRDDHLFCAGTSHGSLELYTIIENKEFELISKVRCTSTGQTKKVKQLLLYYNYIWCSIESGSIIIYRINDTSSIGSMVPPSVIGSGSPSLSSNPSFASSSFSSMRDLGAGASNNITNSKGDEDYQQDMEILTKVHEFQYSNDSQGSNGVDSNGAPFGGFMCIFPLKQTSIPQTIWVTTNYSKLLIINPLVCSLPLFLSPSLPNTNQLSSPFFLPYLIPINSLLPFPFLT